MFSTSKKSIPQKNLNLLRGQSPTVMVIENFKVKFGGKH